MALPDRNSPHDQRVRTFLETIPSPTYPHFRRGGRGEHKATLILRDLCSHHLLPLFFEGEMGAVVDQLAARKLRIKKGGPLSTQPASTLPDWWIPYLGFILVSCSLYYSVLVGQVDTKTSIRPLLVR